LRKPLSLKHLEMPISRRINSLLTLLTRILTRERGVRGVLPLRAHFRLRIYTRHEKKKKIFSWGLSTLYIIQASECVFVKTRRDRFLDRARLHRILDHNHLSRDRSLYPIERETKKKYIYIYTYTQLQEKDKK